MLRRRQQRAPAGWVCLYDLTVDAEHVAQVQKASQETEDFGFPTEPALFGSRRWWRLIDSGDIPSHVIEGTIVDVYWGSMADYPKFRVREGDGTEHELTRQGDIRRYVSGLNARIRRVTLEWKPTQQAKGTLGPTTDVVLSILVTDSELRSPAVAPGPGRVGYQHAGGPGVVVGYFWAASTKQTEALCRLAGDNHARTWVDPLAGAWVAVHFTGGLPSLTAFREATAGIPIHFDGYETIPSDGEEAVAVGPQQ